MDISKHGAKVIVGLLSAIPDQFALAFFHGDAKLFGDVPDAWRQVCLAVCKPALTSSSRLYSSFADAASSAFPSWSQSGCSTKERVTARLPSK
jgi:hypothetical protein